MRIVSVCCVLLTITITATCLQRDRRHQQISDRKTNKRLIKRDASLLVDTSPIDTDTAYRVHPIIAYRRLSKTRVTSRPKQSPRLHKSTKKYNKYPKPHGSNGGYKKRGSRPKYYKRRPISKNNNYSMPPKYSIPFAAHQAEPAGFGEPPTDLVSYNQNDYQQMRHMPPNDYQQVRPIPAYRDELRDSYGMPIKQSNLDSFPPTGHPVQFNKEPDNLRNGYNSWQNFEYPNTDNEYEYSKKRPVYESLDESTFDNYFYRSQKKPNQNIGDQSKFVRMPWKVKSKKPNDEDEIIVGGQYAEPPARYVPKFQPSAPMLDNEEDFTPLHRLVDSEVAASASHSPYVNYKYSNLAFSPQNLNDAFSIVE